jgi:transmembrane sensor
MDSSVRIEEIAADWLAKRDSGAWTQRDETELENWLKSATAHWVAYIRLRAGWEDAGRLKAISSGDPSAVPSREERRFVPLFGTERAFEASNPELKKRREWRVLPWAVAAAVMVTVFMAMQFGVSDQNHYSTPVGGVSALPLPDGSQVTLNTASEIRVAVTDSERRIVLEQGEAFFNVAKDPARPFVVRVGNRRVTVVGTQFAVRRDRDELRVLVTEGKVRLESEGESPQRAVLLPAGAVARDGDMGVRVEQRTAQDLEEMLSWRSGFIVFQDVELAAAVHEFNRYLPRQMVIEDPAIASIRVGGMFRVSNVEAFLRILQADFPVAVERRGHRIALTKE